MEKKLNNLLSFEDFEKNWKPDEQKKTKRTEIGMDIVKESNLPANVEKAKRESEEEFGPLPDLPQWKNRFNVKSASSGRLYVVSQNVNTGEWGCSCPGWRIARNGVRACKHLRSMGLLGGGPSDKKRLK